MLREDVTFDAWGSRCAAWLYRPDQAAAVADPRGLPCVVLAHGFAGVREARLDAFAARFASAGFAALVFDYRGFGASEGQPRQLLSIPGQLADWAAAISYARSLDGVDPERIALWGTSFSGGHVVTTAARDHRIAAVIAQAPFVDGLRQALSEPIPQALRLTAAALRDELGAVRGAPPRLIPAVGPPGSLAAMTQPGSEAGYHAIVPAGAPWSNAVAARVLLRLTAYRPLRHAAEIACPLLVAVCDEDEVTPPQPALTLAERAPRGELVRYAGAGHFDIYAGETFERAVADQIAFFTEQLRTTPAPLPEPALV
ncbi:alpha/beta fold hydrolase [Conexibacter sp. JD483]|uniref:alpha/beta hydrolase n=1 Tax=unclassified Conexibacter TaxID=2627773 RepID=UPI0027194019|nr:MULTISPECIES: alpha/beta fold hydrolase [unclassified Conexibacter]MDO8184830.1 alpha/beta fold hydrolase [Conexibacter sp. CPCC 205706]MDO8196605.1 alpha/beta fold hydrolase [Conexibacter sp. CPCC 205762]MDR9368682.1 alpha/beta fold hydrolase [Conexibacter sp. JD483]